MPEPTTISGLTRDRYLELWHGAFDAAIARGESPSYARFCAHHAVEDEKANLRLGQEESTWR